MPDWIEAEVFRRRPGTAVADAFHLRLGRGALRIVLSASSSVADPGPRYVLHGSLGSFVKSGMDPQEEQLRGGMTPAAGEFGIEPETRWGKLTLGDTGNLRVLESEHGRWVDFYRAIRASVETGSAAPVPAQSARDVLRIIEAARESSARGARVMIQAGS
jgi:scyllo-inositol 2-dehydrogenase (NADP+)